MKLHGNPLSPYVQRVLMASRFKGLSFEHITFEMSALKSAEYTALNPMQKMPVLEDDGVALFESTVICEYLESKYPEPALLSKDPAEAAKARMIGTVADLYVMGNAGGLFGQVNPQTRDQKVVDEKITGLKRGLNALDKIMEPGPYAMGAKFGYADCFLVPILFFVDFASKTFDTRDLLEEYPTLKNYWASIAKTPLGEQTLEEMKIDFQRVMANRS